MGSLLLSAVLLLFPSPLRVTRATRGRYLFGMVSATAASVDESTSPRPDTAPESAPAPVPTLSDAHLVAAAEACRWDTLRFGSCSFKLEEIQSWLDSVRAQLFTRKASVMPSCRAAGDKNFQHMCLLALKAALPVCKRPSFEHYTCFTDTFKALVRTCDAVKRATALSKQAQLTNISMKSSESLVSYLDRTPCWDLRSKLKNPATLTILYVVCHLRMHGF
jgi:hypothetical protein